MLKLMRKFIESKIFANTMPNFYVEDTEESITVYIKNECIWMHSGGGCTMCNFSCREHIIADDIVAEYLDEIVNLVNEHKKRQNQIKIHMNGSFFADEEISSNNRILLVNKLKESCGIINFKVESRFEFLNKLSLIYFLERTNINLEIAIGLESSNNEVLMYSINKGFTWEQFVDKYEEVKYVHGVKLIIYLLFKPPFLNENEAINDVLLSVRKLVNLGIPSITINSLAIQTNTILEILVQEKIYRPLWLWSIIELNSRLKIFDKGATRISMSKLDYYPKPLLLPFNCEYCSDRIISQINTNPNLIWDDIDFKCDCHSIWERELFGIDDIHPIYELYSSAVNLLESSAKRNNNIRHTLGSMKPNLLTDEENVHTHDVFAEKTMYGNTINDNNISIRKRNGVYE